MLSLALISSAVGEPEPAPPEAVKVSPDAAAQPATAGFSGWHAAGIWGGASLGASFGALPYFLASSLSANRTSGGATSCGGSVCALGAFIGMGIGLVGGGVLGYFLGGVAHEGSLAAKIFIIALDVLGLPITAMSDLFVAAATNNFPSGGG
jgi:hypothetical protein